ncbi:hypothetical protein PT2222_100367 [Paraburkholderia tropica]
MLIDPFSCGAKCPQVGLFARVAERIWIANDPGILAQIKTPPNQAPRIRYSDCSHIAPVIPHAPMRV